MAHECPVCGQACYCDIEDVWHEEAPDDCDCCCEGEDGDDDFWDGDDE